MQEFERIDVQECRNLLRTENEKELFGKLFDCASVWPSAEILEGGGRFWSDLGRGLYGSFEFFGGESGEKALGVYFFKPDESFGADRLNACALRGRRDTQGKLHLWKEIGRIAAPGAFGRRGLVPERLEIRELGEALLALLARDSEGRSPKGLGVEGGEPAFELAARTLADAFAFAR